MIQLARSVHQSCLSTSGWSDFRFPFSKAKFFWKLSILKTGCFILKTYQSPGQDAKREAICMVVE
jgi:hypothetical protein